MLAIIVLYTLHDTFDTLKLECQKCHEATTGSQAYVLSHPQYVIFTKVSFHTLYKCSGFFKKRRFDIPAICQFFA